MNVDFLHRITLAKRALVGAILSVTCLGAAAVSFDCTKARSKSERLICSDPELSALDDRLAALASAGKKRAANPRSYQRALDAAWSERQKCQDTACVERWYARRIEVLSNGQGEPDTSSARQRPTEQPVVPVVPARPKVAAKAAAPVPAPTASPTRPESAAKAPPKVAAPVLAAPVRPAVAAKAHAQVRASGPAPADVAVKPNVRPGAQLQVVGGELGFDIPLTREDFLDRYGDSGGQCGVRRQLSGLKASSSSVESDCWTGSECPSPDADLSCRILRIAFDRTGRIVLFTTTLSTTDAKRTEGARHLGGLVKKFAELGGGETRSREAENGRVLSSSATQGQFRLEAEVMAAESGKQTGTFSIATR